MAGPRPRSTGTGTAMRRSGSGARSGCGLFGAAALWLGGGLAAPAASLATPLDSLPYAALMTADEVRQPDSYDFPTGPAQGSTPPPMEEREGRITRRAWTVPGPGMTTLQLLAPLREALTGAGFETVLDCATRRCGGFDFRYALDLLPAPAMNVDLFDFRALTLRREGRAGPEEVFLMVSRSSSAGYVQMVHAGPEAPGQSTGQSTGQTSGLPDPADPAMAAEGTLPDGALSGSLAGALPLLPPSGAADLPPMAQLLSRDGRIVLSDLRFATGAATLEEGPSPSLDALAAMLKADPACHLLLVGHTDSDGALAPNQELSRARAEAVRQRLIAAYGIAPDRIEAHGVGYLAPIASNLTEEGRKANRRVEAILLPKS